MIALDNTEITKAYLGNTEISKMYLGEELVFGNTGTEVLPYDAEVEYIEALSGQYIDLNFGFDNTDEIYTVFAINSNAGTSDKYINSPIRWNNNKNRFGMGVYSFYCGAYGSVSTGNTSLAPNTSNDGNLHTWQYKNYEYRITDLNLSKDCSSITWGGTTANLRLFYGYNAVTKGKIRSYKHIKSGTVVCDFIAVRKDGVGYLYDRENKVLVGSSTTTGFTYGNDIIT